MNVRIAAGASDEEASAIAAAMAEHLGETIEVYAGTDDEPLAVHEYDGDLPSESDTNGRETAPDPSDGATDERPADDLGPTEREAALRAEIADILQGGPQKYRDGLAEEGKLFVRDRLDLWFDGDDSEFRFEDGTFAAFDDWHPRGANPDDETDDRLPADGLITGGATFEGRDVHVMATDYTVKRGSMAANGVEKFLRMQQRALKTGNPVLYLMDSSGGRIDQQTGFFANREGIGKY